MTEKCLELGHGGICPPAEFTSTQHRQDLYIVMCHGRFHWEKSVVRSRDCSAYAAIHSVLSALLFVHEFAGGDDIAGVLVLHVYVPHPQSTAKTDFFAVVVALLDRKSDPNASVSSAFVAAMGDAKRPM